MEERGVAYSQAEASQRPSGEKQTEERGLRCPASVYLER